MIKEKLPELDKLTDQEKLILIGELWDEVMSEESLDLTEWQKEELDRRIKYAQEHPEDSVPWEVVRERLFRKYNA
jgi:putative addiction module component (TIGR02574 family)